MSPMVVRSMLALSLLLVLSGCSRNAIEGTVVRYGDLKPVEAITVRAVTEARIKEDESKALVSSKTSSSGQFRIAKTLSGLLPQNYVVWASDSGYVSQYGYIDVPEKGTVGLSENIVVCPNPPSEGTWIYSLIRNEFRAGPLEDTTGVVSFKSNEGLFGNASAFFVPDGDMASAGYGILLNRDSDVLVHRGAKAFALGQLFRQPRSVLGGKSIEDGWYYNVQKFRWWIAVVVADWAKIDMSHAFVKTNSKDATRNIWAIRANELGAYPYYVLVTEMATGQRAYAVLGGESQPRRGILMDVR